MKKNVGTWDALLRITFGLVGVAWAISRMSRWPYRTGSLTRSVLWLSAMKVAEGITRFCPMLFALGVNSEGLTIRWKQTGTRIAQTTANEQTAIEGEKEPSALAKQSGEPSAAASEPDRQPPAHRTHADPIRARHIRHQ